MLLAALCFVGTLQAQVLGLPTEVLKFTLTAESRWGGTILQPGDYTITLGLIFPPWFAGNCYEQTPQREGKR